MVVILAETKTGYTIKIKNEKGEVYIIKETFCFSAYADFYTYSARLARFLGLQFLETSEV